MAIDVPSKITSTTILQHKKYPISSLQNSNQKPQFQFQIPVETSQNSQIVIKPNLDCFVESDDIRMIDCAKDRNLFKKIISNFRAKKFLINLFHGDF